MILGESIGIPLFYFLRSSVICFINRLKTRMFNLKNEVICISIMTILKYGCKSYPKS